MIFGFCNLLYLDQKFDTLSEALAEFFSGGGGQATYPLSNGLNNIQRHLDHISNVFKAIEKNKVDEIKNLLEIPKLHSPFSPLYL